MIESTERAQLISDCVMIGWHLGQLYRAESEIAAWLDAPQQLLDGQRAVAAIMDGNAGDVLAILRQIEEGVYL